MEYDTIKDILMKKIEQELFNYKQDLIKNCTADEIIAKAYKITFKEQIKDIIDNTILGRNEMKVLLKTEHILDKLYCYWESSDGNIWEQLEDKVDEKIGKMTMEYERKKLKEKVR